MKELELKDIACYLPYGLQCYASGEIDEEESPILFIIEELSREEWVGVRNNESKFDYLHLVDVIPILRPMSDLTKSITITVKGYHNDKEFIPIIELAKVNYLVAPKSNDDYELLDGDNGYRCSFVYSPWRDKKRRFCFQVYKNGVIQCFSCDIRSRSEKSNTAKYCAVSANEIFNLLNQWHFDYRNLIGQGLAIDINTEKR